MDERLQSVTYVIGTLCYPCPQAGPPKEVARPGGLELPTFWFVAIRVKMLNALFGVAYELKTPFFPQLAAPSPAPKTELS